jgi:hypothetical protein
VAFAKGDLVSYSALVTQGKASVRQEKEGLITGLGSDAAGLYYQVTCEDGTMKTRLREKGLTLVKTAAQRKGGKAASKPAPAPAPAPPPPVELPEGAPADE